MLDKRPGAKNVFVPLSGAFPLCRPLRNEDAILLPLLNPGLESGTNDGSKEEIR